MATRRVKHTPVAGRAECEQLIDELARLEVERQQKEALLKGWREAFKRLHVDDPHAMNHNALPRPSNCGNGIIVSNTPLRATAASSSPS